MRVGVAHLEGFGKLTTLSDKSDHVMQSTC